MVKKLGSKLKEQKGFTLIELLAVIVILRIIAAIAIPAIGNVIAKSENKAKVQEALQIVNAAKYYMADTSTKATTVFTATVPAPSGVTATNPVSLATYLDHVKDNKFVVTATYDATTGKYTYTISGHGAVDVLNKKTTPAGTATSYNEQDLVDF